MPDGDARDDDSQARGAMMKRWRRTADDTAVGCEEPLLMPRRTVDASSEVRIADGWFVLWGKNWMKIGKNLSETFKGRSRAALKLMCDVK